MIYITYVSESLCIFVFSSGLLFFFLFGMGEDERERERESYFGFSGHELWLRVEDDSVWIRERSG